MPERWKLKLQFRLRDILVIFLGIAIGYSLNPMHRFLSGRPAQSRLLLPTYVIEPPDILTIQSTEELSDRFPSLVGKHLVGPDGNINLGPLGRVYVDGFTVQQAQKAIENAVARQVSSPQVWVDVEAYRSKTYFVITQNSGADTIFETPITGNETVLDAVADVGVVPKSGRLWIVRPAANGRGKDTVLPVKWDEISIGASTLTNYQLMPRDRLFIDYGPTKSPAN
jgi:protein involved in polysaccharide export with SLBB domain